MTFAQRLDPELSAGQPWRCLTLIGWPPWRLFGLEGVPEDYSLICCIAARKTSAGFQDGQGVKEI